MRLVRKVRGLVRLIRREEGRRGFGGLVVEVKEVCRTIGELAKLLPERETRKKEFRRREIQIECHGDG